MRKLRIVLAQRIPRYDPGESELEARLRRLIDALGLPRPTQQYRVSYGAETAPRSCSNAVGGGG